MGWESSDKVRFDLEPLLQGLMGVAKIKVPITSLLLLLQVWSVKPTNRKSWTGNLLMLSYFTLVPTLRSKEASQTKMCL